MFLHRFSLTLIILAVMYAVTMQFVFPRYVVDDAYITFRYAENLALHGELNWNVGEDPVEGYTGVALPVLLAGFQKSGVPALLASRSIGILSFWLGFLMLYGIARRIRLPALGVGSMLLLYATTPILFTHTFSGLETMLFLSSMLSGVYAAVRKKDGWLSFLLLLTSLIRPEGVAFSLVLFAATGWVRYREGKEPLRHFLKPFIFIYLAPAAVYFLWRFSYYGHLLPNTFYAKAEGGFHPLHTMIDIARFLRRYLGVPFLGLLLLWGVETDILCRTAAAWFRERRAGSYLAAGACFSLALFFVLSTSHLLANFAYRLYLPFLPLLWVLLAFGWSIGLSLLEQSKREKPIRYAFVLSTFLFLVLYQSLFQVVKMREETVFARQQIILHEDAHNAIGKKLRAILASTDTVIVYMDAGAIPYFSRLRTIDFGNLNDEVLASRTLSPAERVDYFFSHNAAAVAMTSADRERMHNNEETTRIIQDPRFKDYILYNRFAPRDGAIQYYEFVYLRKDLYTKLTKEGKLSGEI